MTGDDPFAEDSDTERTVIRPNPGGRRGVARPADAGMPPAPAVSSGAFAAPETPRQDRAGDARGGATDMAQAATGMNPLHAAATTLFALIGRIGNRAQHPDPEALRRSVVAEIRSFETRALQSGVDPRHVQVARYAICATLDDVVLNTPWGEASAWAQQSMVATFHREVVGGDRFYDLLAKLEQDPTGNIALLEVLYMCLTLGFEGRLRVEAGGAEKHQQIRARLARVIRERRGAVDTTLSPHWTGLEKPFKPRNALKPLWIGAGAAAAILASGFLGLSWALSLDTARVTAQIAELDPATPIETVVNAPPVVAAPPDDAQLQKVSGFLEEEIADGIVEAFQDQTTITVRLVGSNMFRPGSDTLTDRFVLPLTRVAAALDDTAGPVFIVGHSDSDPIRSARFPSNLALSLARAKVVMDRVAEQVADPSRLKAEGRADREPIASNDTEDGKARNRRIEIVLMRTDQEV